MLAIHSQRGRGGVLISAVLFEQSVAPLFVGQGPVAGTAGGLSQACAVADPPPGLVPAPIGQAIHRLLLIQAFRPDRMLAMAHMFVSTNLGESFMSIMEQPLDLTHIVDTEVRAGPVGAELPVCMSPQRALPLDGLTVGGPPPHQSPTPRSAGQAEHARPDVLCARVRRQRACGGPCCRAEHADHVHCHW